MVSLTEECKYDIIVEMLFVRKLNRKDIYIINKIRSVTHNVGSCKRISVY